MVVPIKQNRRNSRTISRILRVRRNRRWPEAGMRKCEVVFAQALSPGICTPTGFPNLKVCDKRNTDRQAWDMVQIASGVIDKMKAKYKHTNGGQCLCNGGACRGRREI